MLANRGQEDDAAVLPRGVYKARWRIDGCAVLYAVKRNGDRIATTFKLADPSYEVAAFLAMRRLLDRLDPQPRLRLVKADPPEFGSCDDALRSVGSAGLPDSLAPTLARHGWFGPALMLAACLV